MILNPEFCWLLKLLGCVERDLYMSMRILVLYTSFSLPYFVDTQIITFVLMYTQCIHIRMV